MDAIYSEEDVGINYLLRQIAGLRGQLSNRQSEASILLDLLPISVCIAADSDGERMYANRVLLERLGIRHEHGELLVTSPGNRTHLRFFCNGLELPVKALPVHTALATGKPVRNARFDVLRADGTTVNLSGHAVPLFDKEGRVRGAIGVFEDVTGQQMAGEAMRKLSMAVEQSPESIVVTDIKGDIEYVNPKFTEITGYTFSEALGQNPRVLKSGKTPERVYKELWETILAGRVWRGEFLNKKKNGELYWESASISPVKDDQGRITHFVAVKLDITDRKLADEALCRSKAHLAKSQEIACLGSFEWDLVQHRDEWSDEIYRIFGMERHEARLSIETFISMVHPDDRKKIFACAEDALEKLSLPGGEIRIVRADGTIRWVRIDGQYLPDESGKPARLFGTLMDITERKRAEDMLHARMRLMEFAASHPLEEILRKTLDEIGEITDSPIGFYHFVEADQQTLSLQAWSTRTTGEFCTAEGKGFHYPIEKAGVWVDCVRQRRPVIHNDYASLPHRKGMPEGHARVIRELAVPIVRGDNIVAILGVGNKPSDYTDKDVESVAYMADVAWEIAARRKIEEDLRTARDELEKRVEERTAELKYAMDALATAKAEADLYVDLMGHDINNMNQIIQGFLELALLKINVEGNLTADDIFMLEKAIESIDNSSRLIHNVRKLQSEKAGQYTLEVLDLGEVLADAVAQTGHVSGREVTINCAVQRGSFVQANQLLKDVFINLLGNAIKHSAGPLIINLEVSRVNNGGQDFWEVAVEDNGPGIPDIRKMTLFDRYNLHAIRAVGKGFGLFLVKTLVDDYRGEVRVEDRVPGDHAKGARFVVMLPAVDRK